MTDPLPAVRPPEGAGGPRDAGGYVDLRSYAAVGDGRTVALVAADGRIDWLPCPDLHTTPAFAALLDAEDGGYVELRPVQECSSTREYVPGTNVLRTTFRTATGVVRVTDAMNTGVAGRLPWSELARRVDGVEGRVELRGVVRPGTALSTASPWVHESVHGAVLRLDGLMLAVRTLTDDDVVVTDDAVTVRYLTSPGSRHLLALVATDSEPLFLPRPEDVDRGVDRTGRNWQTWTEEFAWDGPHRDPVLRSALALKLLIHAPTGAVAAAATTSLPESRTTPKNWDYRFAWTRDMAYTLNALYRFGVREEVHAAVSWLLDTVRRHGPEPHAFYRLDGSLPGGQVDHDVPGWRGSRPVVTGNDAADQLQLGVYGDLFGVVHTYVDHGNLLDEGTGRLLAQIADAACDRWHSKDAGMWELHEEQHYTTSKLGCWQALRCAVHLAELGQVPGDADRWRTEADRIRRWVEQNCWDEVRGCWTMYPESSAVDASILLHAISGFDRGHRMSSTLDVLRAELGTGPHLHRYTGMPQEEGAFVACSFWMVSALHLCGRTDEAAGLMDDLLGTTNDVGLLAEMVDPSTGDFLGNLPQALSHLALINAAVRLADDDSAT